MGSIDVLVKSTLTLSSWVFWESTCIVGNVGT